MATQLAVEKIDTETRFPSLNVGVDGGCEMCWTRSGVNVPVMTKARDVFRALFWMTKPHSGKLKKFATIVAVPSSTLSPRLFTSWQRHQNLAGL